MPSTVVKLRQDLPSVEEENTKLRAESMESNGVCSASRTSGNLSNGDLDATHSSSSSSSSSSSTTMMVAIGMLILTSRRPSVRHQTSTSSPPTSVLKHPSKCGSPSLTRTSAVDAQVSSIMAELESLHCEESDGVCIEVRGHQLAEERSSSRDGRNQTSESAKSPSSSTSSFSSSSITTTTSSLLIEQWNFNTVAKRPTGSSAGLTSLAFLSQAVDSFLHFSQISSWAVSCGGVLPFRLGYSLSPACSSPEHLFTHCPPETHLFPLIQTSPHRWLQVSVSYLPRLDEIPSLLLPPRAPSLLDDNERVDPDSFLPQIDTLYIRQSPSSRGTASIREDNGTLRASLLGTQNILSQYKNQSRTSRRIYSKINCATSNSSSSSDSETSSLSHDFRQDIFPFSPPTPSPLSPKLLSGLPRALSHASNSNPSPQGNEEQNGASKEAVSSRRNGFSQSLAKKKAVSTVDSTYSYRPCAVRPPGASSPVPSLLRPGLFTHGKEHQDKKLKRRSCGISITPVRLPPMRSMSLPSAVPNLCLLGSFEESVLNGRIEPCGYVEGFTAELGASGSFCPTHLALPVTAAFFDLSDDGGPSPYLGHIDLSGVGKRGYHVPRKGTIQLTLFNPNKTVVKMFVVTYNHSDMPANSSTFVRQKTLSKPCHMSPSDTALPSLHYLIHLRFLCSKSGRVYLHTDLKLIFARRAPDTDPDISRVSLYTLTEGPTDPKYCAITTSRNY